MSTRDVFDAYLQARFERAGALTAGQKLAVVETLQKEAREEGRVPIAPDKVIVLPLESRSVQAVVQGERVSLGGSTAIQSSSGTLQARLQRFPLAARLGILALLALAVIGLPIALVLGSGGEDAQAASETTAATATVSPVTTEAVVLNESAPQRNPKASDPASLEIGGVSFVLGAGRVRNGMWTPSGAEWLAGTEVRRVVALPLDDLKTTVQTGDVIHLRTRSGGVIAYRVVQIASVQRTQIETLQSLEPSLLIVLYDDTESPRRNIILAVLEIPPISTPAPPVAVVHSQAGGANLRDAPAGQVISFLQNDVSVTLLPDEPVTTHGYTWVRVRAGNREGWVARSLLETISP